ncbi:MAG TPA: ABC transporter permease [Amaricoccus sp.]|uniref:ABC transporter permease n=1 Tax=Amaricoccus sp. TaxID=1872485 RepID=UPI002C9CF64F|nr:ABC transporter permease [Amaricoccus sp.]HMQ92448.1 ABC transporter permease [Amaricoccus sp.]HMR52948.1 ABC transporter permease [Amaricoccus sp.]HMR59483.1 ABC transporter permease [Amaricoccus sp.]HMT99843.1 ABC transporter permease [Amaricoccus sp.]
MELEYLTLGGIVSGMLRQFLPVYAAMALIMGASFVWRCRLGLYGRIYESPIGMIGFALVLFWLLTALMANWVALFDPFGQIRALQNKGPGVIDPETGIPYLLGSDALGRCVFSRMVYGSRTVMAIAPLATLFAYMVGITLGLPAGYFGGRFDTVLSFIANLVLAFPVILLFYLLVTPEIRETAIPGTMAAILFVFPIVFLVTLVWSRFRVRPDVLWYYLLPILVVGGFVYLGLIGIWDPTGLIAMDANTLNIFLAVVFITSPTVFRIVRGLTMDIKTRDYVAAAQTRGERPWYIMMWEILPNARGPLIVDACLRIGYTTILLGTLGFFGLGVSPESPDWGSTINEGRKLLRLFIFPALSPALALMSLVLGLNLLADALREISLKD